MQTSDQPENSESLRKYSEAVHTYMRALPPALDVKISIFSTAMTGALIFALKIFSDRRAAGLPNAPFSPNDIFLMFGIAALVIGIGLSFLSMRPRMSGAAQGLFSVVGFAARPDGKSLFDELKQKTWEQLIEQQLLHCHELALIAKAKAQWFQSAYIFGWIGVVLISINFIL